MQQISNMHERKEDRSDAPVVETSFQIHQRIKQVEQISEQFGAQIQKSYFKTIETVYKTWNFNPNFIISNADSGNTEQTNYSMMQEQPHNQHHNGYEAVYLPETSLIGNISQLKKCSIKIDSPDENGTSNGNNQIMKAIFQSTYDKQQKMLLFRVSDYRNTYVKFFNRMLKCKKENRIQRYMLTNLLPVYYYKKPINSHQYNQQSPAQDLTGLYFIIQQETNIIQIADHFYISHFKPLERILSQDFNFSYFKLSKVFSIDDLDNCKHGFMLSQIKEKIQIPQQHEVKQPITIVGLVNILEQGEYDKAKNKKQIKMWMSQVLFRGQKLASKQTKNKGAIKCSQIGKCKVIIKYYLNDAEYIQKLFKKHHIYLINQPTMMISDSANIIFQVNVRKNSAKNLCIFRISQQPYDGINFTGDFYKNSTPFSIRQVQNFFGIELQTVKIDKFLQKCISRNICKLQVGLLQPQIIYGSIRCSKCNLQIKKDQQLDEIAEDIQKHISNLDQTQKKLLNCRKNHRQRHGLKLWGTIRAADDTGSCLISMEHREVMSFLEISQYYQIIQQCVKQNGRGMVLFSSNKQKNKQNISNTLSKLRMKIKSTYVQKVIICTARTELQKTFRQSLSQQQQLQYQISFKNTKKFLNQKKIFPNGIIEKRSQEIQLLPFFKAIEVLQMEY